MQLVEQQPRYVYFEDSNKLLKYIKDMNDVFKDNKEYTLILEIIPNRSQVKVEIIKNYIWVNQYFSLN
jgi:16S rRNA C1402 (ribose-2'-O) methylase RsmI